MCLVYVVNSKCREQAWPGSRQHTAYVGVGGLSPLPPFTQQLHMKPEARKLKEKKYEGVRFVVL